MSKKPKNSKFFYVKYKGELRSVAIHFYEGGHIYTPSWSMGSAERFSDLTLHAKLENLEEVRDFFSEYTKYSGRYEIEYNPVVLGFPLGPICEYTIPELLVKFKSCTLRWFKLVLKERGPELRDFLAENKKVRALVYSCLGRFYFNKGIQKLLDLLQIDCESFYLYRFPRFDALPEGINLSSRAAYISHYGVKCATSEWKKIKFRGPSKKDGEVIEYPLVNFLKWTYRGYLIKPAWKFQRRALLETFQQLKNLRYGYSQTKYLTNLWCKQPSANGIITEVSLEFKSRFIKLTQCLALDPGSEKDFSRVLIDLGFLNKPFPFDGELGRCFFSANKRLTKAFVRGKLNS